MDGVTDQPFRHIQKKYGQPDLIYTEFTNVEGVCHGAERLLRDFIYDESQRPIVAQIYGHTPRFFRQVAVILCELGVDGIDINMGCPAKNVAHSGSGATLIKTPELAQEIIRETQAGVEDWLSGADTSDQPDVTAKIARRVETLRQALPTEHQERRPVPVSVKTRIGYDQPVIESWIPTLLEMEPVAIGIHGRTLKQYYGGQANWDEIGRAVELARDTETLILGNGDIDSQAEALAVADKYGVDGVLIGRASFGNPSVFLDDPSTMTKTRFEIALEHAQLYQETYGHHPRYNFLPIRKHLGWYVRQVEGASQIRQELFGASSPAEVEQILQKHNLI